MREELENLEAKEALREAKKIEKQKSKKKKDKVSAKKGETAKNTGAKQESQSEGIMKTATEIKVLENESSLENVLKNDVNGQNVAVETVMEYSENIEEMRKDIFLQDNVYKTGVNGHKLFDVVVQYALTDKPIRKICEEHHIDSATFYRCILMSESGKNALEWAQRQKKHIIKTIINDDMITDYKDLPLLAIRGEENNRDENGNYIGEISSSYTQYMGLRHKALSHFVDGLDGNSDNSKGFSFTLNNNVKSEYRTMRVENIKEIDAQDIEL